MYRVGGRQATQAREKCVGVQSRPRDPLKGGGAHQFSKMGSLLRCLPVLFPLLILVHRPANVKATTVDDTLVVNSNTRLQGNGLWRYAARFAVLEGGSMFLYGMANYTKAGGTPYSTILVLVSEQAWSNTTQNLSKAFQSNDFHCNDLISQLFFSSRFNSSSGCSQQHKYREVPCVGICKDHPTSTPLAPESQFTIEIHSAPSTGFWFAVLLLCNCTGKTAPIGLEFSYSFTFVNFDPRSLLAPDPFVNQFPYNLHYILVTFIIFSSLYILLTVIHFVLHSRLCNKQPNTHLMIILFSLSLILESLNIIFGLIHYSLYAYDGSGFMVLYFLMEFFNLLADWILILVFILIAGGWQVTTRLVLWKKVSFSLWALYVIVSGVFFIWEVVSYIAHTHTHTHTHTRTHTRAHTHTHTHTHFHSHTRHNQCYSPPHR